LNYLTIRVNDLRQILQSSDLSYLRPPGITTLNTVNSNPTIIRSITTPEDVNKVPNGTPDAFSESPAVCASGTRSANNKNRTTIKMIASTAVVTLEPIWPFLFFIRFFAIKQ